MLRLKLKNDAGLSFCSLGTVAFREMRALQLSLCHERLRGTIEDRILFCQHPPTLSLGLRTERQDLGLPVSDWERLGVSVHQADRGGGATLHLPGQLLIYPVIQLRERCYGVKAFVERTLLGLGRTLESVYGLKTKVELRPTGLWTEDKDGRALKLCSVGLRLRSGVTDHGFALNVNCSTALFEVFSPCGDRTSSIGSLGGVLGRPIQLNSGLLQALENELTKALC